MIDKLKNVSTHIPQEMNAEQAQRKLIKIIIGVILHVMEEMGRVPHLWNVLRSLVKPLDLAILMG